MFDILRIISLVPAIVKYLATERIVAAGTERMFAKRNRFAGIDMHGVMRIDRDILNQMGGG
nr:hypothetical protein M3O54_008980 [Xanthomonas nasturtii]